MKGDAGDEESLRDVLLGVLLKNYVADGPSIELGELIAKTEASGADVTAVCAELIEAGYAYGSGIPLRALRLSDNGFAFANDALALELLERHKDRRP